MMGAVNRVCSIDGCSKPVKGRGWCAMHLWRFHHHGDPHTLSAPRMLPAKCSSSHCSAAPERGRKGMCARCYRMMYRRGTTVPRIARRGEPEAWLRANIGFTGEECLIWPFARHTDGSAAIASRYSRQAARTMCILSHGEPPTRNHQAAHECGQGHRGCVNPRHLAWKSPADNSADKSKHGTQVRGEGHPSAKLNELRVRAIRALSPGFGIDDLAEIFGVHAWTIRDVVERKTWNWL